MSVLDASPKLALIAVLLMFSLSAPVNAQAPGAPSDWERLLDRPRELAFEVNASRAADGVRWIRMDFEYELVLAASLDRALDTYWFGIERSAEVFARVDSARVLSREPELVVAEQVTGVRILGLAFLSRATFRNVLERPSPETASVAWTLVESDGSIRDNVGGWYFQALRGGPDPRVLVRYRVSTEVEARFPGQVGLMRTFGPGDVEDLLEQFARAVYSGDRK